MIRFRTAGMLAAVAAAALAAGSASAVTKPAPFKGVFSGKAVVVSNGTAATITATAAGTVTPLGKSKLTGKGAGTQAEPCPLFGGTASVVGKKGTIKFRIGPATGNACTDEAGQDFSINGRATFAGGTKIYKKAKGTFKFTGNYNRGTGAFTIKFIGSVAL